MSNTEINTQDIGSYTRTIENLANTKEKFPFANSGKEHACVVMSNIFRTADSHVRIFAKNLNGTISKGEYLTQLENYLKKNKSISVLLEENPENRSEAINLIAKYKKDCPDKITISIADKDTLGKVRKDMKYHFTIADDRMFRFETDTENYTAVCDFNDSSSYKMLDTIFNALSVNSVQLG